MKYKPFSSRVQLYINYIFRSVYERKEEGVHMTNQERIEKYKKEHCSKCKNKDKFDCEIRVFKNNDIVCTKCVYYERQD